MWALPGQEIASSASPFNALILSHYTSKITAGSRQRQGVSHHRREDMIDLTLRDIVISHPTICPCHSLPPWGLVQVSPLKTGNCLMVQATDQGQQSVNMQTMSNNSPGYIWELETLKLCDYSEQILFIRPLGLMQLHG